MKELSLHILDIAQNSISAKATCIHIFIEEEKSKNSLKIEIKDNGKGMDEELLKNVTDPFVTTRKTRKVGLGISLFKSAAERCNGNFEIRSKVGIGTVVMAQFQRDHIDRAPIGNMVDTIITLIIANEGIDYLYTHKLDGKVYTFDTMEIRKILGDVPLTDVMVMDWIRNHMADELGSILD